MELNQLTLYSICLASFYMERVDIHALTKTNLFLLETKLSLLKPCPFYRVYFPAVEVISSGLSALMLVPS